MLNYKSVNFGDSIKFENGHQLNPSALLFEKVEDEVIAKQVQKLLDKKQVAATSKVTNIIPAKENISYESFAAMDIRTGTILTAEKVPKTKEIAKADH